MYKLFLTHFILPCIFCFQYHINLIVVKRKLRLVVKCSSNGSGIIAVAVMYHLLQVF